ncbi:MAG: dienelactone hydrolase family protein [Frankia sp.]
MTDETVTLATVDGPMPTYVAEPAGPPRGGVVVVQEAFGVTEHIQDVARRFAAAGWRAVVPALFHRAGEPAPVLAYNDLEHAVPLIGSLQRDGLMADLDAALAFLAEGAIPPSRTAVVGFCMGGTVATIAAADRSLGAAVAFYGGGLRAGRFGCPPLIDVAPHLRTPWLGLYGDLDRGIPTEDVEAMRTATAKATVPTEIISYPDAQHGFHCDDRPAVFNADAAKAAWARALAWIEDRVPAE